MNTKFFHYSQNNSGGNFEHDETKGIGHHVIIEAEDSNAADEKAENIGLYWDGVSQGLDCGCCGDRWYPTCDKGEDKPMIYDKDVSNGKYKDSWFNIPSYIHYLNGDIKKVKNEP